MKKSFVLIIIAFIFLACENPYELVSEDKNYKGNPFVSLSSEQASIRLGINEGANNSPMAGVFKDSIVLSNPLNDALVVWLEFDNQESQGILDTHFSFQEQVIIEAGASYGTFLVSAEEISEEDMSSIKLAIKIADVDNENVIAGMYGIKKENEDRKKRIKVYTFQR